MGGCGCGIIRRRKVLERSGTARRSRAGEQWAAKKLCGARWVYRVSWYALLEDGCGDAGRVKEPVAGAGGSGEKMRWRAGPGRRSGRGAADEDGEQ